MNVGCCAQSGLCAALTSVSMWQGNKVQNIAVPVIVSRAGVS